MNPILVKYPRTSHFPFSPGATNDDKIQYDLSALQGKKVIMTEKMDGENTTMTQEKMYARSLDGLHHPSRNYVKGMWGNISYLIPETYRICGENMYACHSLCYDNLEDYFLVFSIWDRSYCLSWDQTTEIAAGLGLKTVPVLWRGKFDLEFIKNYKIDTNTQEGFVVRLASGFNLADFSESVVKWVRKGHVAPNTGHWLSQKITPNKLKQ